MTLITGGRITVLGESGREPERGVDAEAMAAAFLEHRGLTSSRAITAAGSARSTSLRAKATRRFSSRFDNARPRVRRRSGEHHARKRTKLLIAARHYLSRLARSRVPLRRAADRRRPPRIEWIRDAFGE